jgi:hypothetical protein
MLPNRAGSKNIARFRAAKLIAFQVARVVPEVFTPGISLHRSATGDWFEPGVRRDGDLMVIWRIVSFDAAAASHNNIVSTE